MGFGVPSAIGAKVARPEKIVVDVDGDASFSMTAMELATAAQYGIGVKILILNNEFQGMVLQWQDLFYEKRYSHTEMTNPDFVKLAEAMNCKALRCTNLADLPAMMKEFMEYDNSKPIVMECTVVKTEHGASLYYSVYCLNSDADFDACSLSYLQSTPWSPPESPSTSRLFTPCSERSFPTLRHKPLDLPPLHDTARPPPPLTLLPLPLASHLYHASLTLKRFDLVGPAASPLSLTPSLPLSPSFTFSFLFSCCFGTLYDDDRLHQQTFLAAQDRWSRAVTS